MNRSVASPEQTPLDRVFLFALLPQVIGCSAVAGLSGWRLFSVYPWSDRTVGWPPSYEMFRPLSDPLNAAALAALGIGVGLAAFRVRVGKIWSARLMHAVGFLFVIGLVLWMQAACLPMHYLIQSMNGGGFWAEYRGIFALLPFLLPIAVRIRPRDRCLDPPMPGFELLSILVLLAALEGGIARDPAQLSSVIQGHGPLPWDLSAIGYGRYATIAASLVANGILAWFVRARPADRARWGPTFVLMTSAATIVICSRKLGYWCGTAT